jgi:drug/metabolite transporter (DMT)-like permease
MTALASPLAAPPSRRQRAAAVTTAALRGGLLAGAVAAIAWVLASAIAGTAFIVLLIATVVVVGITLLGRDISGGLWTALALAWAIVLLERWIVTGHGGLIVGGAAFLGVFVAARRAGISRWALPLLAYPLISVAICIAAGQSLLHPWGVSWLWLAAVLGPVLGLRVLLDPSPRDHPKP